MLSIYLANEKKNWQQLPKNVKNVADVKQTVVSRVLQGDNGGSMERFSCSSHIRATENAPRSAETLLL